MLVESYINVLPKDKETKEKYIDEVWSLIENAYSKIGLIKDPKSIMSDNVFWKMQKRDGRIVAVGTYKMNPVYGRKLILIGQDGSRIGKNEANKILYDSMLSRKEQMGWAECSGAVERKMQEWGAIPIPIEVAKKLLNTVKRGGVEIQDAGDGYHYTRMIEGKPYTKIIYGNVPEKFLEYLSSDYKQILTEDKVVKFDNQTYPKFGWCVIMCGAPGSGKSTVLNNLVPIDAKVYNPDYIKEFSVEHGDIVGDNLVIGNKKYSLDDIKPPYTLKNPDYVSFLHKKLKPLNNKLKSNLYKMGIDADNGRLPNIAFDIAGSDIADFENIFINLAPLGYKFCVVWVFNTLERALVNNANRDRTGNRELIISKYFDVLSTIPNFMRRSDLVQYVQDFWIVLPTEYDINTKDGKHKYIKADNVRKIDITNNKAQLTYELSDMIFDQQEEMLRKYKNEIQS